MIVRRLIALVAFVAVLWCSGCGGNGSGPTPDETSDPLYQQALDLKNQGRNNEALSAFLKVIDRRGEAGAPESHIEAGTLYLNWAKDPFEAYHHFSKYLELRPNGPSAPAVRGQRDAAKRAAAQFLQAPVGDTSVRLGQNEEIDALRRKVQELEAELQTLRGGGPAVTHAAPMIALPEEPKPANALTSDTTAEPLITPVQKVAPPLQEGGFARPLVTPVTPPRTAPASAATERVTSMPTRPGAPQRPATNAGSATGSRRTHTVTSGEKSLWGIARQYYGKPTAAQVDAIYQANRDVMKSASDLRAGMVLRIP